jgi:hypothetical protein
MNNARRLPGGAMALIMCAAHAATAVGEGTEGQSLEQAASDPTASLMSVQVQDIYAGAYHGLDDQTGNTILLRSAVPFKTAASSTLRGRHCPS